jgi:hexosaminidase
MCVGACVRACVQTPAQEALVIGGEASLWGEEIDASNLQQRAWPRGCAFAERMWSPRYITSVELAAPRLARMVCKMKALDIGVSPIGPGSCLATQATYIE